MTPGVDNVTLDGIDLNWFERINKELGSGAFQFKPAASRRVEIPKPKGGTRPLGVVSPRDKIIQEAIKLVLEAVFEPTFLDNSHGFRPGRSCHTAHYYIKRRFTSIN
jgi:RNA-directed DNA polymerase